MFARNEFSHPYARVYHLMQCKRSGTRWCACLSSWSAARASCRTLGRRCVAMELTSFVVTPASACVESSPFKRHQKLMRMHSGFSFPPNFFPARMRVERHQCGACALRFSCMPFSPPPPAPCDAACEQDSTDRRPLAQECGEQGHSQPGACSEGYACVHLA